MPYTRPAGGFERASRIAHVDLARSDVVRDAMAHWETPAIAVGPPADLKSRLYALDNLPGQEARPETSFAIAFDGSLQEVPARAEYPSIRVEYIQLAGVAVVLSEFLAAWDGAFVDPIRQSRAIGHRIVNGVLPGSNVTAPGLSPVETWRDQVYKLFSSHGISDFGQIATLLQGLDKLFGSTGSIEVGICPAEGCAARRFDVALTGSMCPICGVQVWPTDVLRTHEEFEPDASNLTPVGRLMSVCERILTMLYIDGFASSTPDNVARGLFVTDGPLALFGTVAPLKRRFVAWWSRVGTQLAAGGHQRPLLVGIEKSGAFVDHATTMASFIPEGHVLHMDDAYIRAHVARRPPGADAYGKDEFYGRRFIYRTTTGQVLVVFVPRDKGQPYGEAGCEDLSGYPTLAATLRVLDSIQTRLYSNALIPVALAHSAAALPLGTGTTVLRDLARQALGIR